MYQGDEPPSPLSSTDNFVYGVSKQYYFSTFAGYALSHSSSQLEHDIIDSTTGKVHGAGFYPMLGDAIGENADITFCKNRTMIKNNMNFTVGIPNMMTSNP
ncbi:hypothetical protein FACS1894218_2100 [Bacilli bacterium]|nr:hypothetical protein FACS1894218_2100 [Bacilli bacterium]